MVNVNNHLQGDANLLIDDGIISLVDVGSFDQGTSHLVPYLSTLGISKIDHIFISHPHTDHYEGLDALADAGIKVRNIYYNLPPSGSDDFDYKRSEFMETISRQRDLGATVFDISKGFSLNLKNSSFKVLHAQKDSEINGQSIGLNDYSVILRWDANDYRVLFTGDLELKLGTELAKLNFIKSDILKMPHHGVTDIAPNTFFERVSPSLAMYSSTKVLWSHPRGAQAKQWTIERKIPYCHNGLNGTVVLRFNDGISSESEHPTPSCPNGNLKINRSQKFEENITGRISGLISFFLN
jgi:beta-lactamase superfamily II metal-dependent hydrolase